jgi:hypothetical protein
MVAEQVRLNICYELSAVSELQFLSKAFMNLHVCLLDDKFFM